MRLTLSKKKDTLSEKQPKPKGLGDVAQVVALLPRKYEALSSKSQYSQKN